MATLHRSKMLTVPWLTAALTLGCGDGSGPSGDTLRVLFVGNSLTFVNDLPDMVRTLAAADGALTIETQDVSQPDFALEDHWMTPASRAALEEGGWDVVILQQGPSSLSESRANLLEWAKIWADAIRTKGGKPALYMVWPDKSRLAFFEDVSVSYWLAADSADAALYPAGDAWREAWARDPSLALYGPDDFHPSVMGTYLAALTIYRGLTGRDPPRIAGLGISAEEEATLQEAARVAAAAAAATPQSLAR